MRTSALAIALVAVSFAVSCATVDATRDVDEVRGAVSERSPALASQEVAPSPDAADARVRELLAHELTPESAVQLAFLRNRRLGAALAEVGIAQAEWVEAGLFPNPIVSAEVRFGIGEPGTGAELDLVQDLVGALSIPQRRRVAESELAATKHAVAAALFDLASEVREAFFEAQAAEQLLELRQSVAEATALAADLARRQHEAGNLSDLGLAVQRALHEESKLVLAEAELTALEQRERLTALMGLWGGETRWSLAPRLPALPAEERALAGLESLAVERRLDLAAERERTASAARSLALARFYRLVPEAEMGVHSEDEVEGGWSVGPSLDVPIPVFDQGQTRVAIARGRERQSEASFAALAVEIRSEVRRSWSRLQAARARAAYYEQVVLPLRTRILGETQREYNAMLVGVYQLLDAKREEIEAGRAWVESLRDYWVSRVALERALGTELPAGSAPPAPANVPAPEPSAPHHHHHGE
jgi:cobalt-zinc-cadmium efflux system outer membrane protein